MGIGGWLARREANSTRREAAHFVEAVRRRARILREAPLVRSGDSAVDALWELLRKEKDRHVQSEIIRVLGKITTESAVSRLTSLLKQNEFGDHHADVVELLAGKGDVTLVPILLSMLGSPECSVVVKRSVILALGKLRGGKQEEETARSLAELLVQRELRELAASALLAMGETGLGTLLRMLHQHPRDPFVQKAAADAMGLHGRSESLQPLLEMIEDHDLVFRESVVEALKRVGLRAKEESGEGALGGLLQAAQSDNPFARAGACEVLAALGNSEAVGSLLSSLRQRDTEVRKQAVEALARLRNPATVEPLLECLQAESSNLRAYAMYLLVTLGGTAEGRIIGFLTDLTDHSRRVASIEALSDAIRFGRLGKDPEARRNVINIMWSATKETYGKSNVMPLLDLLVYLEDRTAKDLLLAAQRGRDVDQYFIK